jgi:hypothetical protein
MRLHQQYQAVEGTESSGHRTAALRVVCLASLLLSAAACGSSGAHKSGTGTPGPAPRPSVEPTAGIGSVARSFPETKDKILVFNDQLPGGMSDVQYQFAATHYVGSQKLPPSWVHRLRQINPGFLMLHYQLAVGAGPALFLTGEQWTNDFNTVQSHEDWFMHDDQGHRLRQPAWDWYLMDIRFQNGRPSTDFPDYWLSKAVERMRMNEADGCFADSYTQDILIGQLQPSCVLFTDPARNKLDWLPHLNRYGAYCAANFRAQPERFYYLPNLGGLITTWDTVTDRMVGDGGMNEGFCAAGPGNYYALDDWKLQMTRLLTLAAANKIVICQTSTSAGNADHRWFLVGSYLLTKGHRSYLNMFHNSTLEWYPEYTLDLGAYQSEPSTDVNTYWNSSWQLYRRDFAKGFVLVNPSGSPVTVSELGGSYRLVSASGGGAVPADGTAPGSLSTSVVTSVTVPAHSARVLLR